MKVIMLMMRIWSPGLTVAEEGVVLILLGGSRAYIVSPSLPLKVSDLSPKFDIFGGFPMKCTVCYAILPSFVLTLLEGGEVTRAKERGGLVFATNFIIIS